MVIAQRFGFLLLAMFTTGLLRAGPISQEEAMAQAAEWLRGHPIMTSHTLDGAEIETVRGDSGYAVFAVHLEGGGYLLLHSDDRLPLVIAFSASSPLDLRAFRGNVLRTFVMRLIEDAAKTLASAESARLAIGEPLAMPMSDILIEPLLETSWNQNHPFNLLAPEDPGGDESYGFRVPIGCVATALSQVTNFHRWPIHGKGSHHYTDDVGSFTGPHSAAFSDPYDWDNMQTVYSSSGDNPAAAEAAIGELVYELAVAAEAQYESDGTSADTRFAANQLNQYFYYETPSASDDPATMEARLVEDLQAGLPSIVTIPGHAVVADGLLVSGGSTTYHIRYGWGGSNDGWFSATGIPGGAMDEVISSLRPLLMPFPENPSLVRDSADDSPLAWILPRHRESEASALQYYYQEEETGPWTSDASGFGLAEVTSWSLASARTGDGWYAGPTNTASLVLRESFVPQESSTLSVWSKCQLVDGTFSIAVSSDDGDTFTTVYEDSSTYEHAFVQRNIPLGDYAGETIRIRFRHRFASGSYYPNGGVWLDDLSINDAAWTSWVPTGEPVPLSVSRFTSSTQVTDHADDWTGFEVTSTSDFKDWQLADDGGASVFYKEPGGYSNHAYHLTSTAPFTVTEDMRLAIRARYQFATDGMRLLVSTDRSTFTAIASITGANAPWHEMHVGLDDYVGQDLYLRIEYTVGNYYESGGLWIDWVGLQTVTNPELEGQPLHLSTPPALPVGEHLLAARILDNADNPHPLSPPMNLTITGSDAVTSSGVPHAWLVEQGWVSAGAEAAVFEAAAASDPLGKGYPLATDYFAGTDSQDPGSRFQVEQISHNASTTLLSWTGMAGRRYEVLSSATLSPPNWQVVSSHDAVSDLQPLSASVPHGPVPTFWAIRVQLIE